MFERQFPSVQRHPELTVSAARSVLRGPIFPVADDGQAPRRELDAELMAPAGPRAELQRRGPGRAGEHSERQPGLASAGSAGRDDLHHVPRSVLPERVRPFARVVARPSTIAQYTFSTVPVAELRREPRGRLAGPGQQDDARGGSVEPVDQPDIDVARLVHTWPSSSRGPSPGASSSPVASP